jgi:hypothetical protein
VPAPFIRSGHFSGQPATIGHYSLSRCGELLNVLLGHFPFLPLHHLPLKGGSAREWYDSDAYKAIRHLRIESARYIGVLAEGGAPPIDQRMPRTRDVRPAPS